VRGKELKRETLVELAEYVNTPAGQKIFTESLMPDIVQMVKVNLIRTLPPQTDDFDPEEDEPAMEGNVGALGDSGHLSNFNRNRMRKGLVPAYPYLYRGPRTARTHIHERESTQDALLPVLNRHGFHTGTLSLPSQTITWTVQPTRFCPRLSLCRSKGSPVIN